MTTFKALLAALRSAVHPANGETKHRTVHSTPLADLELSEQTLADRLCQHRQVHPSRVVDPPSSDRTVRPVSRVGLYSASALQGRRGSSKSRTQPAKFALQMSRRGHRAAPAIVGLTLLLALAGAGPASANAPWWHITSGSRPSNIQPGAAGNAVRQLTVSATSGTFVLGTPLSSGTRTFEAGWAPAQVKTALEEIYGAGSIEEVTSKPGPNNANEVYVIKFGGAGLLEHRPPSAMFVFETNLVGGSASASVKQLAEGRPDGVLVVTVENVGDAVGAATSSPVQISDSLPAGLQATGASAIIPLGDKAGVLPPCSVSSGGVSVSCTFSGASSELPRNDRGAGGLPVGQYIEVRIPVEVLPGASPNGEPNQVSVSGGGAPSQAFSRPVSVSEAQPSFGVEDYELTPEEPGATLDTQAGSHPFQINFTTVLNQDIEEEEEIEQRPHVHPVALAKDLHVNLPPGLVGDVTAIPRCTLGQFLRLTGKLEAANECPPDTAVGVASVTYLEPEPGSLGYSPKSIPIFNLEPQVGEPARFGFYSIEGHIPVLIDTSLRTGSDYGVTSSSSNIDQVVSFISANITLWGVPGDPRHDSARGWSCLLANDGVPEFRVIELTGGPCVGVGVAKSPPLLDLPTACAGALQSSVEVDAWQQPGVFTQPLLASGTPAMDGCGRLQFDPEIKLQPDTERSSSPTAPTVDVHVPQEGQLDSEGVEQSSIRDIRILLPEGMAVNPSQANGLQACSESQAGFEAGAGAGGFQEFDPLGEPGVLMPTFTPKLPSPLEQGVNFCPDASKIANVSITTPLLPAGQPLKGAMYLASQGANPFGSLVALYLIAEDPVSGSLVKLPGKVTLNETTGQVESVFEDQPDLPFEDAKVEFFDGNRTSLASPGLCGTYTTEAQFTPWSGGPVRTSTSSFQVTQGPAGGACPRTPGEEPNSPSFTAGAENPVAGIYSPLIVHLGREDGAQDFSRVNVTLPPGATGKLTGIPQCSDAQIAQAQSRSNPGEGAIEAADPSCPASSEIGTVTVAAGYGSEPFYDTGNAYLAGPYEGAPYSAVFITPAIAGPFDLGVVVVRAGLYINPTTAQVTTKADPLPTILHGVPLDIRSITVDVNRPEFTLNPTSCAPMTVTGEETSTQGQTAPLSARYQVGACEHLPFKPILTASAGGKGSKLNGTTFDVDVTSGGIGVANIAKVDLTLPKALPSRLTTIQKACLAAVFEANPATCDEGSVIGKATIRTPLLPNPLTGPAYLVSHGGAAFPDVEFVLQGNGVTIILDGKTDIKKGITYSRFESTPDAPFTTFETTLPAGPHSALTADVPEKEDFSLCKTKLSMATEITGQNGAVIKQTTSIPTTGCPKTKTKAQLLAAALKACHKHKNQHKRTKCEQAAHKRYNTKPPKHKKK
jgi:hypothetical protein